MSSFIVGDGRHQLEIDPASGAATFRAGDDAGPVWSGTIHPAVVVRHPDGRSETAYARGTESHRDGATLDIQLEFPGVGEGSVSWAPHPNGSGVDLRELRLRFAPGIALVDLYLGLSPLDADQRSTVPDPDYPEWPDWRSAGFCVPSARPAPAASFLRMFDLGQARVALGQFGPSLGSPYGAAFPRPVYAAAFGDQRGWMVAGVGEVPDGALTLELRSNAAAYRWRHRDDLWGGPGPERVWEHLLRVCWAEEAYDAFAAYVDLFPRTARAGDPERFGPAIWNTWGDFRAGEFDVDKLADVACDMEADLLVVDDGWETGVSTGVLDEVRFPTLREVSRGADGIRVGYWTSVGWIEDPAGSGLGPEDLLHDRHGTPSRVNWAMDPHNRGRWRYALDPSSPKARAFLEQRTRRLIRELRPALLKLDFGYGLPGPDSAAARDPALRGERMGHELYRIISESAHDEDPELIVMLYGIHPLHAALADVISLDDMGDHGDDGEGEGHRHWSVWAALAARTGVGISASSGYNWEQDDEVLLNSAVLGGTGSVLPVISAGGTVPARFLARRRALDRWHRRASQWEPLWLDSSRGGLGRQPRVVSWGRLEPFEGSQALTALCLRSESSPFPELDGIVHSGSWALISLDGSDLRRPRRLAVVPMSAGELRLPGALGARVTSVGPGAARHVENGGAVVLQIAESALDEGFEGWLLEKII